MKKVALSLMMLAVAASGFSQKKMVSKAKTALIEPVDLVEAKTSIEAAMGNEETAGDPYTFIIAGKVYNKIYEAESKKKLVGQSYDAKVMSENLINATNSYINASDLAHTPDAKGKTTDKFDKEIKKALNDLKGSLSNDGYEAYKAHQYESALNMFESFIAIPNCLVMKEEAIDPNYYTIEFLAVNSALVLKNNKKAIRYMFELKDSDYESAPTVYEWLVGALQEEKDTVRSLKVLAEGLKKYPTNQGMISKQVNYYIQHNQRDQAMKYLDDAIAANPDKPEYYNVKGDLLYDNKNFDEAMVAYQKANSIKPDDVSSIQGIGSVYAAKAKAADDKADKITNNAQYQKARKDAEVIYKEAEKYLERAKEIYGDKPNRYNLNLLIPIYSRLKEGEKVKAAIQLRNSL